MPNSFLIDVRTPAEFATGFLDGAINIEYQDIGQLAVRPGVSKQDDITLYCRSGRRSAIALESLKSLGFGRVRDIGSYEAAQETLRREKEEKAATDVHVARRPESPSKESLEKSTNTLLDGLRALE
ncbi:Rhodanese-like protein [Macrophomina phaseolina MS6]|uniref:Rhodanese-like protein n=1 Tax=Macrophomina phaseolina (strain MS6) TaxID=1126212 RepID=K2SGY8_MACPH|nr:Rhodanese-like protein [Macrophomina phaseolina MS6]